MHAVLRLAEFHVRTGKRLTVVRDRCRSAKIDDDRFVKIDLFADHIGNAQIVVRELVKILCGLERNCN